MGSVTHDVRREALRDLLMPGLRTLAKGDWELRDALVRQLDEVWLAQWERDTPTMKVQFNPVARAFAAGYRKAKPRTENYDPRRSRSRVVWQALALCVDAVKTGYPIAYLEADGSVTAADHFPIGYAITDKWVLPDAG